MGRRGEAKVKDPNKPKRPTSAYFYFVAGQREECKKRGEHISRVAEWTKEVSAKWRALTDAQKKPFDAMAVKDKGRYETAMQSYSGKRKKDVNKPKRPQSAYFLFLADFRKLQKDKFTHQGGHKDLIRAAGDAWNKLAGAEKLPYEKSNELDKKRYEAEMANYDATGSAPEKKAKVVVPVKAAVVDDDDDDDDEEEEEEEEESD